VPHLRIWDLDPSILCRKHLLGEHRELHAIWTVITQGKKGYSRHPETLRWKGRLTALYSRHNLLVREMEARGYNHRSPLEEKLAKGIPYQDILIDGLEGQLGILRNKGCKCHV
jgi:hypothetical protein